jgi:hypothetical protein
MTQILIAYLLVTCAATYSFWRLMPRTWRRKLRRQVRGISTTPHDTEHTSGCGSCSGCNGCG